MTPSGKSVDRESENCGYSSPGKNTRKSTSSIPLENHPQEKPLSQGKPMSQVKSSQETQLAHTPKTPTAYQRENPLSAIVLSANSEKPEAFPETDNSQRFCEYICHLINRRLL